MRTYQKTCWAQSVLRLLAHLNPLAYLALAYLNPLGYLNTANASFEVGDNICLNVYLRVASKRPPVTKT